MSGFVTKDMNGLRLVKGAIPAKDAVDILHQWAKDGFTDADRELNAPLKADAVFGSKEALARARAHFKLPPKS